MSIGSGPKQPEEVTASDWVTIRFAPTGTTVAGQPEKVQLLTWIATALTVMGPLELLTIRTAPAS